MRDFDKDRIQEMIEGGRKNRRTAEKVVNWCRNAKIARFGGVGLLEQMSGEPIGHLGVECDHARGGSSYAWDLEETAVKFIIQNCEGCAFRAPGVGLTLEPEVAAYRKEHAANEKAAADREAAAAAALAARQEARNQLCVPGDPQSGEIIELLNAIDAGVCEKTQGQLLEIARLAPEAFTREIAAHLDEAVDADGPLAKTAIAVLLLLSVDPVLKRAAAIRHAGKGAPIDEAVRHLGEIAPALANDDVKHVLPALVLHARPPHVIGAAWREPNPAPLLAVAAAHGAAVSSIIREWLDSGHRAKIIMAGRAIDVLAPNHPKCVKPFLREILGKLLRRRSLLPDFSDEYSDESLPSLRKAAEQMFRRFPKEADAILQSLLQGADATGKAEFCRLNERVLNAGRHDDEPPGEADAIAFHRTLWMAVDAPDNLENDALHVFRTVDERLLPVASEHFDALIGAAATLTAKMEALDKPEEILKPKTGFEAIEKNSKRSSIDSLQGALCGWAFAVAARQGVPGVKRVLEFYEAHPEKEIQMRANMVAHLTDLMISPAAFNLVLPHLYAALTSPDVLVRASAATAIGKAPRHIRRDLPDLVFEVFLALMTDSYVCVHRSAVLDLHTHDFPAHLKNELGRSLYLLIVAYANSHDNDAFLVKCLEKYVQGFLTDSQLAGRAGAEIVSIIARLDALHASDALRQFGHAIVHAPGFVALCAQCLPTEWMAEERGNIVFRWLQRAREEEIRVARDDLVSAAAAMNPAASVRPIIRIASVLAKAGCWTEAHAVCSEALSALPETRRNRSLRFCFQAAQDICSFENARPKRTTTVTEAQATWNALLEDMAAED